MADLDVSNHSLNLSTSKQKYSFPRTKRFQGHEKALYSLAYPAAMNFTPSPPPSPRGPPCSDTAIRLWESIIPLPLLVWAPIASKKRLTLKRI